MFRQALHPPKPSTAVRVVSFSVLAQLAGRTALRLDDLASSARCEAVAAASCGGREVILWLRELAQCSLALWESFFRVRAVGLHGPDASREPHHFLVKPVISAFFPSLYELAMLKIVHQWALRVSMPYSGEESKIGAEAAMAMRVSKAPIRVDLRKCFETYMHEQLFPEAVRHGFPMSPLLVIFSMYWAPRVLACAGTSCARRQGCSGGAPSWPSTS